MAVIFVFINMSDNVCSDDTCYNTNYQFYQ